MSDKTTIEWADATWSPLIGCTRVSPGCDHCYAITTSRIRSANPNPKVAAAFAGTVDRVDDRLDWTGRVNLLGDRLDQPLRWKRPRRIFVNSMSDLFHDQVPDDFIAQVWAVMSMAPQHTFQILTKRHARMRALLRFPLFRIMVNAHRLQRGVSVLPDSRRADGTYAWPLPNVWLGVSTENQQWADIRIPALLDTPAAVRFISAEPLLGPILLTALSLGLNALDPDWALDWVIVGGESGPGARPMHLPWAQSIRDECVAGGVPFLFKQNGEWVPTDRRATGINTDPSHEHFGEVVHDGKLTEFTWRRVYKRVGKKAAGRELDGRTWDEYPEAKS